MASCDSTVDSARTASPSEGAPLVAGVAVIAGLLLDA
jgi:hypothetical protein